MDQKQQVISSGVYESFHFSFFASNTNPVTEISIPVILSAGSKAVIL